MHPESYGPGWRNLSLILSPVAFWGDPHSIGESYLSMLEEGVLQWTVERRVNLEELDPLNGFTVTPLPPEQRWKPGDPAPKNLVGINVRALDLEPKEFVVQVHFEDEVGWTGWRLYPPWAEIKTASIEDQCDILVRLVCQYGFTFVGTA